MKDLFNADFFRANRQRLATLFAGTAPIVLTAHGLLQRNNDSTYAFRQDSHFWYLTGITEPDILLVIDKGKEYLIVPGRSVIRAAFDGSVTVEDLIQRSGIEQIYDDQEGWRQLTARLKRVKHVATLAPPKSYIESHGMYTNPARRRLAAELRRRNPSLELLDLRPHLTKMRCIKQPAELQAMQTAINLTVKAFNQIRRKHFAAYRHEYEVDAALTGTFRKANAGHAYQPIVASGKHACTLHYVANDAPLEKDGVLLIDAGAEVSGYGADITRSYALQPPTKRQLAVHKTVLEVQQFALAHLKLGVSLRDYEHTVEHFMGEKLRELGLIRTIESEAVRRYYPHATSHFLGLDGHDVGDYDQPLEPDMTLTVEPGIYIPEEGLGIRIEDDILMTAQGPKVLTKKLPQTLYE